MVKEYEWNNEGECYFCFDSSKPTSIFSCSHLICSKCLYRHIFCYHIEEIKNAETLNVKCKCQHSGFIELDMSQLQDLMTRLEANEEEKDVETCKIHTQNNILNDFCKECNKKICRNCHINLKEEHYGHRVEDKLTLTRKMKDYLIDFISTITPKEVFDKLFNQFSDNIIQLVENDFKETSKSIKALIETLQQFHRAHAYNYKRELEKIVYNIKVLKMFYSRFYSDLEYINNGDIYFLKYIINIKSLFVGFDLKHKPEVDQTLNNIKVQVEDLKKVSSFLSSQFDFQDIPNQFRLVSIISKAHSNLIKSIIQLSDDKLVTGGEDEILRIWEEQEKGYYNIIRLKNFIGIINTLLPLKNKRFASGGKRREIKIWALSKQDCECKQSLLGHNDDITSLANLRDGRMISGAKDCDFIIWKETNEEFEQVQKFTESSLIYNLIPLYDSRIIISTKSSINLWKEDNNKFRMVYSFPNIMEDLIKTICQLKDGKLAIAGNSCYLYIWEENEVDVFSIKQKRKKAHDAPINAIVELNNGSLASASIDRRIHIWKKNIVTRKYEISETINQYSHGIYSLIQLKDGRLCTAISTHNIVFYKDRSDYY